MKHLLPMLTACLVLAPAAGARDAKPNILLMLADDLGYGEPGCYGNPRGRTPNIDRLAARGARFTSGYAASNVCSPSRAALLTGRYIQRKGPVFEDYFGGSCPGLDPKKDSTLGRMARDAGYATGCFGKWNVSHNKTTGPTPPNAFGFDRWVGLHLNHNYYTHRLERGDELDLYEDGKPLDRPGIWSDTLFADEAIRFIESNRERPFFIYLPWQAPHSPLQDPGVPNSPPVGGHSAENRPLVEKMIHRLDTELGRVLEAVERNGLAGQTLIIMTSDNGGSLNVARNTPLRGWKQELWEGGIRVPLIVSWPGVIPAGCTIDSPVIHMDLTATLAALMGAEPPPAGGFDGVDLLPLLKGGRADFAGRPLFWRRRVAEARGEPTIKQSSVRQDGWTYIRNYQRLPGSGGTAYSNNYTEELFDLDRDIAQTNNLLATEPERLRTLQTALDGWERQMAAAAATHTGNATERPLVGVNYFAGWWEPLPNKWHGKGWTAEEPDWRPQFPDRVPLLGEYNDPPTMDREIAAAAAHGVDFFSILWYFPQPGSRLEARGRLLNRGLENYLASPNAGRMRFMIEYCNAPDFSATSDAGWSECVNTWVAAMKHPSYLRVDGRLVFKVHSADQFLRTHNRDLALCRRRLQALRDAVRGAGLGEMVIGGGIMCRNKVTPATLVAQLFDFTGTYMSIPEVEVVEQDLPYAVLANETRTARAAHDGDPVPWMPCLAAGWNPRPWTHPKADTHHRLFFTFPSRAEWTGELQALKADLQEYPRLGLPKRDGSCQPAFTIYAWNEFGEGGIIAPTRGDQYMKLEAIREVFPPVP